MKVLALGLCSLCALLVFWVVQHDTKTTQTPASGPSKASPEFRLQPASGSEMALTPGTVVFVTLADPIHSSIEPFEKQYAASVNSIGGHEIAPGSQATITLLNNNTGWLTQLTGLTVKGRKFQVLSGAGAVIVTGQASNVNSSSGILKQIGFAPTSAPASNQAVVLPSGTQLRFVLAGSQTPVREVAASRHYRPAAAGIGTELGVSPVESVAAFAQEPEFAYLCRANEAPDRTLPISYYIADVFKTSDSQAIVERRWYDFLIATYPYKFANNRRVVAQCTRITNTAAARDVEAPGTAAIVQTRWHYTLGFPPSPAYLPAASALPLHDAH
jgi:hypothetical protein